MKKTILVLSLTIITAILSYQINWIKYLLLIITLLCSIFLIALGFISIFKKLKRRTFKVPVVIIAICILGVFTSLFQPYEPAIINSEDVSENLKYAYKTDQNDRKELKSYIGYFSKLEERDNIRLTQIRECYNQDKLSKPIDKFHAAFVFHHSDNSNDYKIASELAEEAANSENLENNYTVQWLKKASHDRYMVSIGKPEKYNTQNNLSIDFN